MKTTKLGGVDLAWKAEVDEPSLSAPSLVVCWVSLVEKTIPLVLWRIPPFPPLMLETAAAAASTWLQSCRSARNEREQVKEQATRCGSASSRLVFLGLKFLDFARFETSRHENLIPSNGGPLRNPVTRPVNKIPYGKVLAVVLQIIDEVYTKRKEL